MAWVCSEVTEFSATLGVYPGYVTSIPTNGWYDHFRIDDMVLYWDKISYEVYKETKILVSCIINDSRAVYPREFGCPKYGETTFTMQGNRNPKYCEDDEAYRASVIKIVEKLKVELKQSTVTLVFRKVDSIYIT